MLNRFVKIIEQVDPEQNNKHHEQEEPQQFNHDNDNHNVMNQNGNHNNNQVENQRNSVINISEENNDNNDDEITDYDISDPFVAEYNHKKRSSVKRRDNDDEEASPAPIIRNHHNNNENGGSNSNGSPYVYSSVSAQHQFDQFIDSSSSATHYLNYLSRTGSFDLANAVASNDIKALLERIATLESSIIQSNYERQVLQCRLESNNNHIGSSVDGEGGNSSSSEETHPATHQETLRHLRRSLVEQIEKNDALTRDFQGRVVQLEYDLVVARKKQQEVENSKLNKKRNDDYDEKEEKKDTNTNSKAAGPQQLQPLPKSQQRIDDEESSSQANEKLKQLEAKLLDAQKKNDAMQRKAAEALQKSTLRESTIQQELDFVQKELLETRRRLIEAQKPIDHQLEDQLKKNTVFAKINSHTSTAWGDYIANAIGGIDRCGVRVGRFFANHAMIRFFFVLYVICLHIYIFHLFAAVLHHLETTSDDVHDHLNKLHQHH